MRNNLKYIDKEVMMIFFVIFVIQFIMCMSLHALTSIFVSLVFANIFVTILALLMVSSSALFLLQFIKQTKLDKQE